VLLSSKNVDRRRTYLTMYLIPLYIEEKLLAG
jgi:hypothetical protein